MSYDHLPDQGLALRAKGLVCELENRWMEGASYTEQDDLIILEQTRETLADVAELALKMRARMKPIT